MNSLLGRAKERRRTADIVGNVWPAAKVLFEVEQEERWMKRSGIPMNNFTPSRTGKPGIFRVWDFRRLIKQMAGVGLQPDHRTIDRSNKGPKNKDRGEKTRRELYAQKLIARHLTTRGYLLPHRRVQSNGLLRFLAIHSRLCLAVCIRAAVASTM